MKIRLFLYPPGEPATLLEVTLPEEPGEARGRGGGPVRLLGFSPPPDSTGDPGTRTRAWTVELGPEAVARLWGEVEGIRVVPFGSSPVPGDGTPAELALSSGQAEARFRWWIGAPGGWSGLSRVVATLRELGGAG